MYSAKLDAISKSVASLHEKVPSVDDTFLSPRPSRLVSAGESPRRSLPVPKDNIATSASAKRKQLDASASSASLSLAPFLKKTRESQSLTSVTTRSASLTSASAATPPPAPSALLPSAPPAPLSSTSPASLTSAPPATPPSAPLASFSSASPASLSSTSPASLPSAPPALLPSAPPASPASLPPAPLAALPSASSESLESPQLTSTRAKTDQSAAAAAAASTATTKVKSFASATKDISSPKWNLVTARNKKRIIPVIGQVPKKDDDDIEGVPPPARDFWDISVSRLKETVTADKVRSHLHKFGIEVKDVFLLSSKIQGTKSAKVRVAREHKDRAKSPEIWPLHCKIADWVNFKRKNRPVSEITGPATEIHGPASQQRIIL